MSDTKSAKTLEERIRAIEDRLEIYNLIAAHPDWYTHDAAGHIVPPNPDWVDVADLDYSNAGLRQYMTAMLVRWLHDYDLACLVTSGNPCGQSSNASGRELHCSPSPTIPSCC